MRCSRLSSGEARPVATRDPQRQQVSAGKVPLRLESIWPPLTWPSDARIPTQRSNSGQSLRKLLSPELTALASERRANRTPCTRSPCALSLSLPQPALNLLSACSLPALFLLSIHFLRLLLAPGFCIRFRIHSRFTCQLPPPSPLFHVRPLFAPLSHGSGYCGSDRLFFRLCAAVRRRVRLPGAFCGRCATGAWGCALGCSLNAVHPVATFDLWPSGVRLASR